MVRHEGERRQRHSRRSISIPFQRADKYNLRHSGTLDGSDRIVFSNELHRGKQDRMPFLDFLWVDETVEHLVEHGVSQRGLRPQPKLKRCQSQATSSEVALVALFLLL